MQPPITHYKDEAPDQTTQDLVNKEIEKEAAAKAEPPKTPELKVLPVEKPEKKPTSSSSIVNAFRQKMSLNTTTIEIPSVGKSMEFKEISTSEQKEMAKIAMESDSRSDTMYCSMISLINKLSVDKGFDVRDYTEFDRIFISLNLQQMNKINPEIKFTCSKCGKENSYRVDTSKVLRDFAKTFKQDRTFEVETKTKKFTIVGGWPSVRRVENFYKNYYKKYDNAGAKAKETINNLSQIEYLTLFLKSITVCELSDPEDKITASLADMTYPEMVQIIDCLPQTVLFDDDIGIISKLIEHFVNPLNDVFKYNDCAFCGEEQTGAIANITDFFGF